MTSMINMLYSSMVFWVAWIIIPLMMEIIPTFFNFLILLKRKIRGEGNMELKYMPEITLIIPVYNSAETLYQCIKSVYDSNYDNKMIYIMAIDNMSTDNSFEVFCKCQRDYPELTINWMSSKQGKSKALNLALFNSSGKYIIHVDSDGVLHPDAIRNIVAKFENNEDVYCVTGAIMTNPDRIDESKGFFRRLFLKMEFFEYCQAFLAGRNFQSEYNSMFTLSGAFSAFRKSSILKTHLYNTDTICEDTHVTFQIRDNLKEKVVLCDSAIFFVEPIENMNKLYTQRQRWQRGEMEVIHMFMRNKLDPVRGFFSNFVMRLVMFDHTFAFPRMIWYFALICLAFINYPMKLVVESIVVIYILYVISSFMLYLTIVLFLSRFKDLRNYYAKKWYMSFFLPIFNFIVFWFRFAGIVNSIKGVQTWKTKNFTQEKMSFKKTVKKDFKCISEILEKIRNEVNNPESDDMEGHGAE
nr:TIGR03111 family XrtG-associated glycosyltransferase [Eubacterium xylanophilum]